MRKISREFVTRHFRIILYLIFSKKVKNYENKRESV